MEGGLWITPLYYSLELLLWDDSIVKKVCVTLGVEENMELSCILIHAMGNSWWIPNYFVSVYLH
jgi:hypothetical protein